MKNTKALSLTELASVSGGKTKYYGNGVYCDSKKCWVDWSKATSCVATIVISGAVSGNVPNC